MEFVVRTRVGFEPSADVFIDEERQAVVVAVEVAGADPESLRLALDDRYLLISGVRPEPRVLRRGSFAQKEIAYGSFTRRVHLPVPVDVLGDAAAHYVDGVLTIALPLAQNVYLPPSRIEIRMLVKRTLA